MSDTRNLFWWKIHKYIIAAICLMSLVLWTSYHYGAITFAIIGLFSGFVMAVLVGKWLTLN